MAAWVLGERGRVFFVELAASALSGWTGWWKGAFREGLRRWRRGIWEVEGREIWVGAPPPVLPFRFFPGVNWVNGRILGGFARRGARKLGMERPVAITFQADTAGALRRIEAEKRVYWCTDDWSASGKWWQPRGLVRRREEELVGTCDLVVASSRALAGRWEKAVFLPNGVDLSVFDGPKGRPKPAELEGRKGPVIGFAGMMTPYSFDAELVKELARRRREWTFLLVGDVEGPGVDLSGLRGLENVIPAGFKPREELPRYLESMDVCLIPWAETEWVKCAFSLKLFEYLAMGRAVVAVRTEEYEPYLPLVKMARGVEGFEKAIEEALREDSEELREKRIALARENGWEQRIESFLQALGPAGAFSRGTGPTKSQG